ncbi:hypothetical protein VPH35_122312 [Triticum aestivum]
MGRVRRPVRAALPRRPHHRTPGPHPSFPDSPLVHPCPHLDLTRYPLPMCQTRYCMKYRHCDGKLVLKVTDDRECLKFKTDQAQDAKKMEKLNNIFFALMTRGPDADISEVSGKEQAEQQQSKKGRGRRQ